MSKNKPLIRCSDCLKNTHISFKLESGEILVIETNPITITNPISNNPSYIFYDSVSEYLEDFQYSFLNHHDSIRYVDN